MSHRRLALLALLATPGLAQAASQHVVGPGGDFTELQVALDSVDPGDQLLLSPGTWSGCFAAPTQVEIVSVEGAATTILECDDPDLRTLEVEAPLTLEGVTVRHTNGAGIRVQDVPLTIVDSVLEGFTAPEGGAILAFASDVWILGSEIRDSHAESGGGGAVRAVGGRLSVQDTEVYDTTATFGGAFAITSVEAAFSRITVSGASAVDHGGAIFIEGEAAEPSTILRESVLTGNTASGSVSIAPDGGAVKVIGQGLVVLDSELSGNVATRGGAISSTSFLEIRGTVLDGNHAQYGGAVFNNQGTASIAHSTLSGNVAEAATGEAYGGAVYSDGASQTTLTTHDVDLVGNVAEDFGGGVYAGGGQWTGRGDLFSGNSALDGGGAYVASRAERTDLALEEFVGNTATARGGGLYAGRFGTLQTSLFSGNDAEDGGGLFVGIGPYYPNGELLQVSSVAFEDNVATRNGGAIAALPVTYTTVSSSWFERNSAERGGAIHVVGQQPIFVSGSTLSGLVVSTSTFLDNTATEGGALHWTDIYAHVINSRLFGNEATGDGGAGFFFGVQWASAFSRDVFCGNASGGRGGAIYQAAARAVPRFSESVLQENTAAGPGGAYFEDGTLSGTRSVFNRVTVVGNQGLDDAGGLIFHVAPPTGQGPSHGFSVAESVFQSNGWAGIAPYGDVDPALNTLVSYNDFSEQGVGVAGLVSYGEGNRSTNPSGSVLGLPGDPIPAEQWSADGDCTNDDLTSVFDWSGPSGTFATKGASLWPQLYPDTDGDGANFVAGDCQLSNVNVGPTVPEVPGDSTDNDCYLGDDRDGDGDSYVDAAAGGSDCDDTLAADVPVATDADCDGLSEGDRDGDGHDAEFYGGDDCDDNPVDDPVGGPLAAEIHPGVAEAWYTGGDQDCDGWNDFDQDRDGFLLVGFTADRAGGASFGLGDCDDQWDATYPGAPEITDARDNDCDHVVDPDADGDGVLDGWETLYGSNLDATDSDGDGLPDGLEWGPDEQAPRDSDADGQIDALDADSDGDVVPDSIEGDGDHDGDELADYRDDDDDDDGIPTATETNDSGALIDTDADGTPDYLDLDSDDDGAFDRVEGVADDDGDGIGNWRDPGGKEAVPPPDEPETRGFGCATPGVPASGLLGLLALAFTRRRRVSRSRS